LILVKDKSDNDAANIKTFFDDYAEDFSSIYKEDEKKRSAFNKAMDKLYRKDIEIRFDTTIALTEKDSIKSVLDIGCGPGHFVVKFLEQGKDVTALDIAPSMLDITKKRVELMKINSKFETILADYAEYDFSSKFDAVCAMGFFDYMQDPVKILKKLLTETNKELYLYFPDDKGWLAWQRKLRYKLRNCPLYFYSKEYLEFCLKEADCFHLAEIRETDRGFYVIIRK